MQDNFKDQLRSGKRNSDVTRTSPQPKMIFRKYMDNSDRVIQQMLDNRQRDPEVNLRTLLGSHDKVMNLRPLEKEKHVHNLYKSRPNPLAIHDPKPAVLPRLHFKSIEE